MNICYLSRTFSHARGGIETYTSTMANALINRGHKVCILTSSHGKQDYLNEVDKRIKIIAVDFKKRLFWGSWILDQFFSLFDLFYSYSLARKLRQVIKDYRIDIVESPDWLFEGLFYAFKKPAPLVVRLHGHEFRKYSAFNLSRRIRRWFERLLILNADSVVSVSESYLSFAKKQFNIKAAGAITISPGVDQDIFYPDKTKAPAEKNILFVGRLNAQKGINILAEAIPLILSKFPEAKFTIIGKGDEAAIRKHLNEDLNKRVVFNGGMEHNRLAQFYNNAVICVFPSLYESFGITAVEAMACGCPVIATKVRGFTEYLKDGYNGILVDPNDSASLAGAIGNLLDDSKLRERLGEAAYQTAKEKYDLKKICDRTINHYAEVLKNNNK
jgi:glycosyltransferase involved in cell wall biosynthesis